MNLRAVLTNKIK